MTSRGIEVDCLAYVLSEEYFPDTYIVRLDCERQVCGLPRARYSDNIERGRGLCKGIPVTLRSRSDVDNGATSDQDKSICATKRIE